MGADGITVVRGCRELIRAVSLGAGMVCLLGADAREAESPAEGTLRQRVVMAEGIFLVLEAPEGVNGEGKRRGRPYLLWYRDLRDNRLYLHDRLVWTGEEVAAARRGLRSGSDERRITNDKLRMVRGVEEAGVGIVGAGEAPGVGWQEATLDGLLRLVGAEGGGWGRSFTRIRLIRRS